MSNSMAIYIYLIALFIIIGFIYWIWRKGYDSGVSEGIRLESERSHNKIIELGNKLYSDSCNHFRVSNPNAWGTARKTDIPSGMVSRATTDCERATNDGTVSDSE